jgi:hypothetical protein
MTCGSTARGWAVEILGEAVTGKVGLAQQVWPSQASQSRRVGTVTAPTRRWLKAWSSLRLDSALRSRPPTRPGTTPPGRGSPAGRHLGEEPEQYGEGVRLVPARPAWGRAASSAR